MVARFGALDPYRVPDLVQRFDTSRFDTIERTPQGGVRVPARVTRTGVFEYAREDGTIQREWRPPAEVFHADALATLEDAPVTDLHPDEGFVEPSNYQRLARGHARAPRADGDFVAATLVVQDGDLADAIERKDRTEISLGYRCRLDMTSGVLPSGERYDAVQRDIRYNHVAVGPQDWGRAGAEVRIRLDSKMNARPTGALKGNAMAKPAKKMRRDNDDVPAEKKEDETPEGEPCPTCGHVAAPKDDELDDDAPPPTEKTDGALAKILARQDALEARNKKLEADLAAARDPKRQDAAAKELVELRELARDVGVKKLDGLSTDEIKRAIVGKAFPTIKLDGKIAAYIDGLVDSAREQRADSLVSEQRRSTESDDLAEEREDDNDRSGAGLDFFDRLRAQARQDARNGGQ